MKRRGNFFHLHVNFHLGNACKLFCNYIGFEVALTLRINMLEIASAAAACEMAWCLYTSWAGFDYGDDICSCERFVEASDLDFNYLTGDGMANENHGAFIAGDEMSPVSDLLNLHPKNFTDMERFSL
jgi:hypothetical protein